MMMVEMLKALIRKITPTFDASDKYRPERHYMRGPGPKAKERSQRLDHVNNAKA